MILTKTFVVFITALVCTQGTLTRGSEREPSKSEILLRLNRLIQMLQEKEHEKTQAIATERKLPSIRLNSDESQRQHMLQRRQKLEVHLKTNPGLRRLIKSWLQKQKLKESKSDECWPGLFYCRDESENDIATRRRTAMKKKLVRMLTASKTHDAKRPYCPPGFFYCPNKPRNNDESEQHKAKSREQLLNEMFPSRLNGQSHSTKEMEDLDGIIRELHKEQRKHPKYKAEEHKVEFVRVPSSVRKFDEVDETTRRKSEHGEKLADDLMKSVQDTNKKSTETKAADNESNFDLKQLMQLLKA